MVGSEVITKEGLKLHLHKAEKKKYAPTVIFIHHMWGNYKTTWRHYRFLNEKGFDCVTFDLLFGSNRLTPTDFHPLMKYVYKGVFYVWTRQIRCVLNEIAGDKIIYAFSGPSLSAFWAADGRNDVCKIICDGGPFTQIYSNTKNFFFHEMGIRNQYLNRPAAFLGASAWGYQPLVKLKKVLQKWPKETPILSIRGKEDHIVTLESIEEVFHSHNHLELTRLELEHGKHLDGFRDYPDAYQGSLLPFITKDLEKTI